MTALPPAEPPSSFAQVYALEAQYQAIEEEYKALMHQLNHTCVGKEKAAAECVKAAQLNANMQTTLAEMSETLKKTAKPSIVAQQQKLLGLADELEAEYAKLTAKQKDTEITTAMFKSHYLAWTFGAGFLIMLVWKMRRG
jgi:hypothetical protein